MESRFPEMLFLWLGREFYRGKYGMTGSIQAWTPELVDKSKISENAIRFSISLFGEKICLNVLDDLCDVKARREDYKRTVLESQNRCVLIGWYDFGVSSAVRAR
ncbi:hypothetical protein AVEN_106304-1 [Araneus ventricosus]|uniref:Uncharacterized protein n=1 Tax=Araneus ventricosus TaxID=182803 RepID=A0A4Y2AU25_ARAVE|nr:hypothetical protein AVEN_106304-1 [Araneus ventricosus]